jgi:cyclopropane-fatty-acyl-phospholipid synthase
VVSEADQPGTAYARLYLDRGLNHSAGYFATPDTTLEEAQRAKTDTVLRHCRIEPGQRLLDVGCGWGATAMTAASDYGADVVGLTIDPDQHAYAHQEQRRRFGAAKIDFRLQDWQEFTEPVDRIICVNAFENFERKNEFIPHCRGLLPVGGVLVILTVTADRPLFRVISRDGIVALGERAGFRVEVSASLAAHYARTLDHFVANLSARRDEAVRFRAEPALTKHIEYYSRCAGFLRSGINDMFEFTFVAQ